MTQLYTCICSWSQRRKWLWFLVCCCLTVNTVQTDIMLVRSAMFVAVYFDQVHWAALFFFPHSGLMLTSLACFHREMHTSGFVLPSNNHCSKECPNGVVFPSVQHVCYPPTFHKERLCCFGSASGATSCFWNVGKVCNLQELSAGWPISMMAHSQLQTHLNLIPYQTGCRCHPQLQPRLKPGALAWSQLKALAPDQWHHSTPLQTHWNSLNVRSQDWRNQF